MGWVEEGRGGARVAGRRSAPGDLGDRVSALARLDEVLDGDSHARPLLARLGGVAPLLRDALPLLVKHGLGGGVLHAGLTLRSFGRLARLLGLVLLGQLGRLLLQIVHVEQGL